MVRRGVCRPFCGVRWFTIAVRWYWSAVVSIVRLLALYCRAVGIGPPWVSAGSLLPCG